MLTFLSSANPDCNLWYQRIAEIHSVPNMLPGASHFQPSTPAAPRPPKKRKRVLFNNSELDAEDEIQHFHRVQVIHQRFIREKLSLGLATAPAQAATTISDPQSVNDSLNPSNRPGWALKILLRRYSDL